jgi:hypothetical protein
VSDAELLRKALVPGTNNYGRWSILGQSSLAASAAVRYLSVNPTVPRACAYLRS